MPPSYSYRASVKSDVSDERINVYLLRPAAGLLVRILFDTRMTPNQVTIAGIAIGALGAVLYSWGHPPTTALAGICLTLKDLFDSADGQLARARKMYSRRGRFLDSIGDMLVNALVFAAIGAALMREGDGWWAAVATAAAFLGMSLRVSYHVFYHTSFLHVAHSYEANRTSEEMRAEDWEADRITVMLQRIFQVLYGWQDRFMFSIDRWSRGELPGDERWFGNRPAVQMSGWIGLGTELFLLTVCSLVNSLHLYLGLNLLLMNIVWGGCILYRRVIVRRRIAGTG